LLAVKAGRMAQKQKPPGRISSGERLIH